MSHVKRIQVTEDEIRSIADRLLWNLAAEISDLREAIEQQHVAELVRIGENLVIDRKAQMKWLYHADERSLTGWKFSGADTAIKVEGDEAEWFWSWLTNYGK